jgi:hypothetical protein
MEKDKPKYSIKPEYIGKEAWTSQPPYERKDGAKFTLNEKLSQKDLAFLFEVIGYEGIEIK